MRIFLILFFSVVLAPMARAQPESPDPAPFIAACEAGDGFSCLYAYGVQQRADRGFWLTAPNSQRHFWPPLRRRWKFCWIAIRTTIAA